MNKRDAVNQGALLFIFLAGHSLLNFGCAPAKTTSPKPPAVNDLVQISIVPIFDKSSKIDTYQITEKFRLTPDAPEKTTVRQLPKADIHTSSDYKSDYSDVYTAQMLFNGEGYMTMEISSSYECGSVTNVVLSRFFIQNGTLVKKTFVFPKASEGCSDGGNYYLWKKRKSNLLDRKS